MFPLESATVNDCPDRPDRIATAIRFPEVEFDVKANDDEDVGFPDPLFTCCVREIAASAGTTSDKSTNARRAARLKKNPFIYDDAESRIFWAGMIQHPTRLHVYKAQPACIRGTADATDCYQLFNIIMVRPIECLILIQVWQYPFRQILPRYLYIVFTLHSTRHALNGC